jgi:drug/metabolite transporter (DMT)-like permease
MTKSLRLSPYLLLTLANLFWAGNWIVSRAFHAELPPVALSFWRWVVALLCLLPLALPHVRRDWPQLRAAWPWLLFFGALGTGGYNVLVYGGLQHTTAINGTLLNSFIPIMIVLISWLLGRRLHARGDGNPGVIGRRAGIVAAPARLTLNVGDLWILASVVAWATYTLLLARRPRSSAGLPRRDQLYRAAVPVSVLSLGNGPGPPDRQRGIDRRIVYTGVFPAFLGYILWNRGVAEVGAARAGLFMHASCR